MSHEILTPHKMAGQYVTTVLVGAIWWHGFGPRWALGYLVVALLILTAANVAIWRDERHARANAKAGFHKGQRLQRLEPWWDGWKEPRPEPRLVTYEGPGLSLGYQVVRYDDDPYDHWCKTEHLVPAPLPTPFRPEESA